MWGELAKCLNPNGAAEGGEITMRRIASVSFGKDSLAMLLYILENNIPLDEVIFYDTGMEFQAIYNILERMRPILAERKIKLTILRPKNTFEYMMFSIPHKGKHDGVIRYGYGWCGGFCRWGTHEKLLSIDKYCEEHNAQCYVGIASDEKQRLEKERKKYKKFILAEIGMTEADCLEYCRRRGWNWNEKTPITKSGYIDLYDILDRVSCWCCCNKNRKELKNIYIFLPDYWERLKDLQRKIARPMKKYKNKAYGEKAGNVFALEKQFKDEVIERKGGDE